jgi:signal transduction histidine kinase/CheY-like chemotaxis protein
VGLPLRLCVDQSDRGEIARHLVRFRAAGYASSEVRLKRAGVETEVYLESRRTVLGDDLSHTTLLDLSERRRADRDGARIAIAEADARQVNAIQDRFVAVLSHELRAPLAPVLAAVASLKKAEGGTRSSARLCEIIERNVLREARLIDDLLDVSRIRSGKVRLTRETMDLHLVAREALEMVAPEATARRLSLRVELGAERHRASGDSSRMRQVFTNLLRNAAKFTSEGGEIAVRSWNHGGAIVVEVSDTGIGIQTEALDRIFESFEQLPGPSGTAGGGLGLGLAISRGIVELHGGSIIAHSAGSGRGSRFLVELEALPAEASPAPDAEHRLPPPGRARAREAGILLVEDEPDLAEALSSVLEAAGYQVQTAATAAAALAVKLENVQLVISDIGLPDLDGRQLLGRLKSKQPLKAIALSGYGTEADVRASREAGFERHLTKPVEMGVLLEAVDLACAAERQGAHRSRPPSSSSPAKKEKREAHRARSG